MGGLGFEPGPPSIRNAQTNPIVQNYSRNFITFSKGSGFWTNLKEENPIKLFQTTRAKSKRDLVSRQ